VLLDARREGHRGDGPASSFEWAVSAAASAAVHLSGQRYGVRLLLDDSPASWTGPYSGDGAGELLDELAVVTWAGPQVLSGAVTALTRTGGDGLVVAVLGEVGEDEVTPLARLGRQGARGVAILLRTTQWAPLPQRRAAELDEGRERAAAVLRSAGWAVAEAGPRETISEVWLRGAGTADPGARPRLAPLA
jgi:uncharacterized protein (DUF58 family)